MKIRITLLMLLCSVYIFAQDAAETTYEILEVNFSEDATILPMLGISFEDATNQVGFPLWMKPVRGAEPKLDDIVTYHLNNIYFFWHDNHLWQMGFDKNYTEKICGVSIGTSLYSVVRLLGVPYKKTDTELYYRLSSNGFPIAVRFAFKQNLLTEIYLYRSDL